MTVAKKERKWRLIGKKRERLRRLRLLYKNRKSKH
jgi:hypothetical protein